MFHSQFQIFGDIMHPYCAYITHQFFGSYKRGWYLLWINMCLYANRQWSHITARLLSWYTDILRRCFLIRHSLYHFEILPLSKPKHIIYIYIYIADTVDTSYIMSKILQIVQIYSHVTTSKTIPFIWDNSYQLHQNI